MTTSIAVANVFSNVWNSAPSSHDWNKSQLTGPLREQVAQEQKRIEGNEKPEQDVSRKPEIATGRPPGDNRTAEQIINDNPILKNLGHQKDVSRSLAYKLLGDWTSNNKDPDARADAAFNAARVLNYIDTSLSADGEHRGKAHGNGDLEGITRSGDARHGTPAGMWKDFTEQGYLALREHHRLDSTSDTHVRKDGTNKDNVQWAAGEAGKRTRFIPGLSNILLGIGDSEPGVIGAIKGAKAGFDKTRADGFDEALASATRGNLVGVVKRYINAVKNNEAKPNEAQSALDKISS
ncbi:MULTISPECIES: hypothetical protein [Pseudomonas]|uniref:hypothetical protein n=1 Tax=Pseudomonas TaxID=286 RepID=UPI0018E80812|nr:MULTISPECIES: hypothetical protein [Pseudomonas]MBJ2225667.1 hypothetical protein [Pseudomonas sp. MF7451]MBW9236833.1 hypothetical protein [Pseudomonas carnis]MDH0799444.1 hypothetical protein [Pseudomonas carnis]